jgi:CBS-domain-containing membrane protein
MKSPFKKIDKKFRLFWKNYVFQSLFATFAVFILLLSLNTRDDAAIIASLGASAFIIFAMPKYITARPRNIIGGHLIGLVCGILCAIIPHPDFMHQIIAYSFFCALAVGLSMFLMVITDTEHPPAAGTALGVVIKGFSLNVTIAVIVSAVILSLIRHILKNKMKDLV